MKSGKGREKSTMNNVANTAALFVTSLD